MENLRHHQSTSSEETQSVAWALPANLLSDNPNRAVVFIFIPWRRPRYGSSENQFSIFRRPFCNVHLARVQTVLTLDAAAQPFDDFRRAAGAAQSCVLSCPKWGKVIAALFFGGGFQCADGCACQGERERCVIHRTGFSDEAGVKPARRAAAEQVGHHGIFGTDGLDGGAVGGFGQGFVCEQEGGSDLYCGRAQFQRGADGGCIGNAACGYDGQAHGLAGNRANKPLWLSGLRFKNHPR